jgi:hypothetical protein
LTINPAKCTFASTSVKFLGHMVTKSGITPLPKRVAAIQEFPQQTTVKQLQQFRRFLPKIAATLRPLTDLLCGNPKTLDWSAPTTEAFSAAKAALVAAVPLSTPHRVQLSLSQWTRWTLMSAASRNSWKTGPGDRLLSSLKSFLQPRPAITHLTANC